MFPFQFLMSSLSRVHLRKGCESTDFNERSGQYIQDGFIVVSVPQLLPHVETSQLNFLTSKPNFKKEFISLHKSKVNKKSKKELYTKH